MRASRRWTLELDAMSSRELDSSNNNNKEEGIQNEKDFKFQVK